MLKKTVYTIRGHQDEYKTEVFVNDKKIKIRNSQKLRNHSSTGFNWGYSGSGPAQLALALCMHLFLDNAIALAVYQDFKDKFVKTWPQGEDFEVTIDLASFLEEHADKLKQLQLS